MFRSELLTASYLEAFSSSTLRNYNDSKDLHTKKPKAHLLARNFEACE
jgi:hypothetical protein